MSFILFPELSLHEREEELKRICVKKGMENYSHSLQQSEIDVQTKLYASDGMELKIIKEQLDNVKKEYADKISAIVTRQDERLDQIKYGKKEISGILYGIPNHAEKRMMYYDKFGELISSRDLLPDEMQGRLQFEQKAASGTEVVDVTHLYTPEPANSGIVYNVEDDPGGKKLENDIKPEFTPVSKKDEKAKRNSAKATGNDAKQTGTDVQSTMDAEMPLTVEMQQQLQKDNAAKNKRGNKK